LIEVFYLWIKNYEQPNPIHYLDGEFSLGHLKECKEYLEKLSITMALLQWL